jgi:hypothetical protein
VLAEALRIIEDETDGTRSATARDAGDR